MLDVDHDRKAITDAVYRCIEDREFRQRLQRCETPYGDGYASDRIVSILSELNDDKNIIRKKITF